MQIRRWAVLAAAAIVLPIAVGCSQPDTTATPVATPTDVPTPASQRLSQPSPLPPPVPRQQRLHPHPHPHPPPHPTPTLTPSPTPTEPPKPQSRLETALSWVPLEYAELVIEFADLASSRAATDLEDARTYSDYEGLDRAAAAAVLRRRVAGAADVEQLGRIYPGAIRLRPVGLRPGRVVGTPQQTQAQVHDYGRRRGFGRRHLKSWKRWDRRKRSWPTRRLPTREQTTTAAQRIFCFPWYTPTTHPQS